MISAAYWISPKGAIIEVDGKHISMVISNPKKFGLSKESIKAIYDKYNEPVGLEGKAREYILKNLFKNGWIRIRKYRNFWSVNMKQLTNKTYSWLQNWALDMITAKEDMYMPVKIDTSGGITSSDLKKIALNESSKKYKLQKKTINELEDIPLYDFAKNIGTKLAEYLREKGGKNNG